MAREPGQDNSQKSKVLWLVNQFYHFVKHVISKVDLGMSCLIPERRNKDHLALDVFEPTHGCPTSSPGDKAHKPLNAPKKPN